MTYQLWPLDLVMGNRIFFSGKKNWKKNFLKGLPMTFSAWKMGILTKSVLGESLLRPHTHSEGRKVVISHNSSRKHIIIDTNIFLVQPSVRVNGLLPHSKLIGVASSIRTLQFSISFCLWELITIKSGPASELPLGEDGCHYSFCGRVTEKGKPNTPTPTSN